MDDWTELVELRRLDELERLASGGGDPLSVPDAQPKGAKPAPEPEAGIGDKIMGGIDAAHTVVSGGIGAIAGLGTAAVTGLLPGNIGSQEGAARAQEKGGKVADFLTHKPTSAKGKEYVQDIGHAVESSKLAGLGPVFGAELSAIGGTAKGAGRVAAASPEAEAVKSGVSKAGLAVTPKIAPDVTALARKAQELGIELRPDMLTNNTFAKMIGEAMEKVPLSGSKTEQRQQAFNRALMATIGADEKAHKLTPDVFDKAMTKSGQAIGDIAERNKVKMDPAFDAALTAHADNAARFGTTDAAKIVNSYIEEIRSKVAGGEIDGKAYKAINSKLGRQMRSTDNGDLKFALGELQDDMHEALTKSISGADAAALQTARKQYAIGKTLEPLVAKSADGDISPASLMGVVTSDKGKKVAMARGKGGDVGELAKIGQMFLKEPKSSGTAERNLAYGLIGDAGRIARDAAIYPAANLYNRLGPKLSQKMTGVKQSDIDRAKLGYAP